MEQENNLPEQERRITEEDKEIIDKEAPKCFQDFFNMHPKKFEDIKHLIAEEGIESYKQLPSHALDALFSFAVTKTPKEFKEMSKFPEKNAFLHAVSELCFEKALLEVRGGTKGS